MKRFLTLLLMLLLFSVPAAAQAAGVPVYLEGERLPVEAVQRGEHYYVPLRPMLELFGYQPEWNGAEQRLSAVLADEEILYLWPGREDYELDSSVKFGTYNYITGWPGVPAALLIGGQVYMESYDVSCILPLEHNVSEGGGAVEYTYYYHHITGVDLETGQELDLNTHTGQLFLAGEELARLELPFYDTPWGNVEIVGWQTPGGNYLLLYSYNGRKIQDENFADKVLRVSYFINTGSGAVQQASAVDYMAHLLYRIFSRLPQPQQLAGEIWLSGDDGIWQLEDKPGAGAKAVCHKLLPKVQALGLPLQHAYCYWTDGRYMLLGDLQRFAFYDMQKNKGVDLTDLLLGDGSADLINQYLQKTAPQVYTEAGLAEFWQRLNRFATFEHDVSQPWLFYDHFQEDILYFELSYKSYANAPHRNEGSYVVSLGLQQLKEML